jgi:hypothetical protein
MSAAGAQAAAALAVRTARIEEGTEDIGRMDVEELAMLRKLLLVMVGRCRLTLSKPY